MRAAGFQSLFSHVACVRCFAVAIGASVVLAPIASAEQIGLRPSLNATNYIHVQPVEPFSRDFVKVISGAVGNADVVRAAAARWHAQSFGAEAAAAAQLPSGALYGEVDLYNGDQTNPYAYGVRVSVPLFDGNSAGYATEAQYALSKASRDAAIDELAGTLVDLVTAAAAIRLASETLEIRRAQYTAVQDLLGAIVAEKKAGLASTLDTDQVEAQLLQLEIDIKSAQSSRTQAIEGFERIAGEAPPYVGAIGSIAKLLPPNEQDAMALALRDNPKLAQRIGLASAAHLNTKSLATSFGPNLSLDLSAGIRGDFQNTMDPTVDVRAGLKLEVPLTFGTEAVVQQSAHNAQAADFEINAARLGVVAGLRSAYQRLANTRSSLSLAYDALERARSVRRGTSVESELGERGVFDMLSSESGFAEARIRIAGLQYELTVAEHLLAAQVGRIDDIYGVTLH